MIGWFFAWAGVIWTIVGVAGLVQPAYAGEIGDGIASLTGGLVVLALSAWTIKRSRHEFELTPAERRRPRASTAAQLIGAFIGLVGLVMAVAGVRGAFVQDELGPPLAALAFGALLVGGAVRMMLIKE